MSHRPPFRGTNDYDRDWRRCRVCRGIAERRERVGHRCQRGERGASGGRRGGAVSEVDPADSGLAKLTTAGNNGEWTFSMRMPLDAFVVTQLKTTVRPTPTVLVDTMKDTIAGLTVNATGFEVPSTPESLEISRTTVKVPGLTKMCSGFCCDE